jgi:hypothetical protein
MEATTHKFGTTTNKSRWLRALEWAHANKGTLPTVAELMAIKEDKSFFDGGYWTADGKHGLMWVVHFKDGNPIGKTMECSLDEFFSRIIFK